MVLVCQDVRDPLNIGSVFRLADAMGVRHLYLCGNSPKPPHRKISKTARSTDQMVAFTYYESTAEALRILKNQGYHLLGLEITDQSKSIITYDFTDKGKMAIVIGAESQGIVPETLELLDETVHIPMYGQNTSINVVQACGIALYEITKQLDDSII